MDNSEIDSHLRDCRRRATVGLTDLSTAAKASQNLQQKQQFKSLTDWICALIYYGEVTGFARFPSVLLAAQINDS